jgi:uroporphyrin-III C-methyltransferase
MSEVIRPQVTESSVKSRTHFYFLLGFIVMSLFFIASVVFFAVTQSMWKAKMLDLQSKVQTLQTKVDISEAKSTLIATQLIQAQKSFSQFQQKVGQSNEDWVLAEVQYLVQLSGFNLQFSQNLPEAILLLQMADKRLAVLQDPRLLSLRQNITDSLTKLNAIVPIDAESILLRLNALESQVSALPIIATPEDVIATPPQKHHHHQPGWKRNLQESWLELQKLIVVQYHDQPVGHLISPVNRPVLDMHLQMLLAQAEWAVIHSKGLLYQQSLQAASDWVKNYYVETSPKTQAMLAALSQLHAIDIAPELPDLSDTLTLISTTASKLKEDNATFNTSSLSTVLKG